MTDQLITTGLEIDDLATRKADLKAGLRAGIDANLDLAVESPFGQLSEHVSEHQQQAFELLEEVFGQFDPDQATGISLDALCLLTGTRRQAASFGEVGVSLDLDAATMVPGGTTVFAVATDPDNTWVLDADVTSVGAGVYAGTATASLAGRYEAAIGTITTIVTPVAGLNSVTNAAAASPGEEREEDEDLRLRREIEVSLGGSTSTSAIRAELSDLAEIVEVQVLENDLDQTADGIPAHAIEVLIWDGSPPGAANADIAALILSQKAAGIRAHGTTVVTVVDDSGSHAIGFTRATPLVLELRYILTVDADTYPGDAAFQAAVAALDVTYLGIGDDVLYARWLANGFSVAGVLDITSFLLRWNGAGWGGIDLTVGTREIATLAAVSITVIS